MTEWRNFSTSNWLISSHFVCNFIIFSFIKNSFILTTETLSLLNFVIFFIYYAYHWIFFSHKKTNENMQNLFMFLCKFSINLHDFRVNFDFPDWRTRRYITWRCFWLCFTAIMPIILNHKFFCSFYIFLSSGLNWAGFGTFHSSD